MNGREALLAFLQLSLALLGVLANHFVAWRSFRSHLEAKEQKEIFSQSIFQPKGKKKHFRSPFRSLEIISQSKGHFRSKWRIWQGVAMGLWNHFAAKGEFRSPFWSPEHFRNFLKLGGHFCSGGRISRRGIFATHFAAAKWLYSAAKWHSCAKGWFCNCEIPALALRACLQTDITSSFQLQIEHRLKHWTRDFPRFEMKYGIHNLSSRKCSKNVSNNCEMGVRLRHFSLLFT